MPFWFAAGVPAERVSAVRAAFMKVWQVRKLRQRAEKVGITLNPKSGEEVARVVRGVLGTPVELLDQLKKILVKK